MCTKHTREEARRDETDRDFLSLAVRQSMTNNMFKTSAGVYIFMSVLGVMGLLKVRYV